jgi:CysZ protein
MTLKNSVSGNLKKGFFYFYEGQRFVFKENPSLFKYFIVPSVIGILFMISGFFLFFDFKDYIIKLIKPEQSSWYMAVIWDFVVFLILAATAVTGMLLVFFVFTLSTAPFNDVISEKVEVIAGSWQSRPFSVKFMIQDIKQSIVLEMVRFFRKMAWIIPLYIASLLIPVVGSFLYMLLGGYKMSKYLGMDYVDWALARRGYTWKQRARFADAHKAALVGFGFCVMLALMVPMGFILFLPGTVAGGTLLCTSLLNSASDKERSGHSLSADFKKEGTTG